MMRLIEIPWSLIEAVSHARHLGNLATRLGIQRPHITILPQHYLLNNVPLTPLDAIEDLPANALHAAHPLLRLTNSSSRS